MTIKNINWDLKDIIACDSDYYGVCEPRLEILFSEDDIVQGSFGWQEYAISGEGSGFMPPQKLPEGISPTSALSFYGITGLTAYFGMLDIGKPEKNDTVLVSGAAGATGSVAGQIA